MYRYIINRILLVFPTLAGAATLVFIMMRLIPGDICLVRLGSGGTSFTAQALAACHVEIGIDRSWIAQYLDFIWGVFSLNLGNSMWSGKPVLLEIVTRLPISLEPAVDHRVDLAVGPPLDRVGDRDADQAPEVVQGRVGDHGELPLEAW